MAKLINFAFLCLFSMLYFEVTVAAGPVKATIYYESQCGDSRRFVLEQLLPSVLRGPELFQPVLIPFGKANVTSSEDSYEFTCQHGPTECLGNKIHACAIAETDNPQKQIKFVACFMSNFTDVWDAASTCSGELGLSYTSIRLCAIGTSGTELLRAYGSVTKDLDPPLTFVPTININEIRGNQTALLEDFWGEIVKASEDVATEDIYRAQA